MSAAPNLDPSFLDIVRAAVPGAQIDVLESIDSVTAVVDREHLLEVAQVLRDHPELQFSFLSDVTAVDRLPAAPRFEVVYHLACIGAAFGTGQARRFRLKVRLTNDDPTIPTISAIWPVGNWAEREVFDLFGIVFIGHPDLRRILMTDDWEGHPLRKDYPVQIRKDTASWSPMQLTEEQFAANMKAARDHATRAARALGNQRGSGD